MLVMSPLRITKFLFWQITQYLLILAIFVLILAQPSCSRYGTPIYPAVKDMAQVVYNTKGQWTNVTYMLGARVFSTGSAGLSADPTHTPDISAFLPDMEDRISGTYQDPISDPVTLDDRLLEGKESETDREGTDNSYVNNGNIDASRSSVGGTGSTDDSDMALVREGSETEHLWKVVPHRLRGRNECTKSDIEQAKLLNADLKDKQLLDLPTTLYLGGLFESTDLQSRGRSEFHSAQMAIGHINEKGVIPGYKLDLVYNETAVSAVFSFLSNFFRGLPFQVNSLASSLIKYLKFAAFWDFLEKKSKISEINGLLVNQFNINHKLHKSFFEPLSTKEFFGLLD